MSTDTDSSIDLGHLPPIDLDELISVADLQTRRDRKYLLPSDAAKQIVDAIDARALDIGGRRTFRYESIYFDTPGWDSYLGSARRRPRRFKVRTRSYLDSDQCMLEVKVRDHRGNTVKHRRPYALSDRGRLTGDGLRFVRDVPVATPFADALLPVLTVAYRRSTLVLEGDGERVTIDEHPLWLRPHGSPVELADLVLIETKTTGPPSSLDRALWRAGHRPVTISKYCTGLAAIERHLPSNKWHRVLHRHLLPREVGSASRAMEQQHPS